MRSLPTANVVTRRRFIYQSGATVGALAVLGNLSAQPQRRRISPNEKLNIAVIGAGGRGTTNIAQAGSENIVALCDVNEVNLDKAAAKLPGAKKYIDFRKLYDESRDIDAVM